MTLEDAEKVAEAVSQMGNGFYVTETAARLRRAFPQFVWGFSDCAMNVVVSLPAASILPVARAA